MNTISILIFVAIAIGLHRTTMFLSWSKKNRSNRYHYHRHRLSRAEIERDVEILCEKEKKDRWRKLLMQFFVSNTKAFDIAESIMGKWCKKKILKSEKIIKNFESEVLFDTLEPLIEMPKTDKRFKNYFYVVAKRNLTFEEFERNKIDLSAKCKIICEKCVNMKHFHVESIAKAIYEGIDSYKVKRE